MKKYHSLFGFMGLMVITISCNEIPDISMEVKPKPVVYTLIDKMDTINQVVVTKTFSGDGAGPLVDAKNWDSIYYKGVVVVLELLDIYWEDSSIVRKIVRDTLTEEVGRDKNPGIFSYPDFLVYTQHLDISEFERYILTVQIPGYKEIHREAQLAEPPIVVSPGRDGQNVKIQPEEAMRIGWYGERINDVHVDFEILSFIGDSTTTTHVVLAKDYVTEPLYADFFQTTLTYELLLSKLNSAFSNHNVEYRKFGNISVTITTATGIDGYIEFYNGRIDNVFSTQNTSQIGFIGSRASTSIKQLKLDPACVASMMNDPHFQKFKFIRW